MKSIKHVVSEKTITLKLAEKLKRNHRRIVTGVIYKLRCPSARDLSWSMYEFARASIRNFKVFDT